MMILFVMMVLFKTLSKPFSLKERYKVVLPLTYKELSLSKVILSKAKANFFVSTD